MAKIRKVITLHPATQTATVTSVSKGTKIRKDPTGKLWPYGLCKVVGEEALPIEVLADVLVVKDGK